MTVDLARVPKSERAAVKRLLRESEAAFQGRVIELARTYGWLVHAERPSRRKDGGWATPIQGDAGFPDLVLVHSVRGLILFAELKAEDGKLSDAQGRWLEALNYAADRRVSDGRGTMVRVWYPSDWQEITATLGGSR